jgi:hypothetical protein
MFQPYRDTTIKKYKTAFAKMKVTLYNYIMFHILHVASDMNSNLGENKYSQIDGG